MGKFQYRLFARVAEQQVFQLRPQYPAVLKCMTKCLKTDQRNRWFTRGHPLAEAKVSNINDQQSDVITFLLINEHLIFPSNPQRAPSVCLILLRLEVSVPAYLRASLQRGAQIRPNTHLLSDIVHTVGM